MGASGSKTGLIFKILPKNILKPREKKIAIGGRSLILLFLSGLFSFSLLYSVYLLSISLFLFGLFSIWDIPEEISDARLRRDLISKTEEVLNRPEWWLLSIPFFIVLFGGLYSDESVYWLTRIRIKVPFLFLPLVFYLIPKIEKVNYGRIHLLFLMFVTLSTLPIAWHMMNQYDVVLDALRHGRPVTTPVSHIRYSLFIAFAICISFIISNEDFITPRQKKWLRYVGAYLIIFLHFLAVRSGIVALYLVALYFIFRYMLHTGKLLHALILSLALFAIPLSAYRFVPSFKQRINYMVEDADKYQKMQWNDYSDAERILSLRAGLAIAKKNPFFGTGTGDLPEEMQEYFYNNYMKDTFIMPHNQFVSIAAGSGFIGLILFLAALIWPVYYCYKVAPENHLFISLNIIILISLFVENTLETSIGVAFYLFFILIGLNEMNNGKINHKGSSGELDS